ncbi:MAG: hypothetical protein AAGF12_29365 [Myxococcota bacterium]
MSIDEQAPTMITGAPAPTGTNARRGQVFGERFEIEEALHRDLFGANYRVLDQESEAPALLRIIEPALLPEPGDARRSADKLRSIVGVGGAHLPGLVEADCENGRLFVVEPWPAGTTLREVLTARQQADERLSTEEVLPIVARIQAGLSALPPGWIHGCLTPSHIWIDPDSLSLTGGFVATALPSGSLANLVRQEKGVFAPELLQGQPSTASDRFATAAVAFEALTGSEPIAGAQCPAELGKVGKELEPLLSSDPGRRGDLLLLLEALAESANLPVPLIDPGAFGSRGEYLGGLHDLPTHSATDPYAPLPEEGGTEPRMVAPSSFETLNESSAVKPTGHPKPGPTEETVPRAVVDDYVDEAETAIDHGGTHHALARLDSSEQGYEDAIPTSSARPYARRMDTGEPTKIVPDLQARPVEGAGREGTMEVDASQYMEEVNRLSTIPDPPSGESPSREEPAAVDGQPSAAKPRGLDLEQEADSARKRSPSIPDIDPRLMRAALGVTLSEDADSDPPPPQRAGDTDELHVSDLEALEVEDTPTPRPRPAPAAVPVPALALAAAPPPSSQALAPPHTPTPNPAPRTSGGEHVPPRTSAPSPFQVAPPKAPPPADAPSLIPSLPSRVPRANPPGPVPSLTPAPDEGRLYGAQAPPARKDDPPPREKDPTPKVVLHDPTPAPRATLAEGSRPGSEKSPATARRPAAGIWILVAATILAALIIGAGVFIASLRQKQERERLLEEHYLELQQESASTPN